MEQIYKCPNCGEVKNLHFNYDLTKQHRPVSDVLCNNCGEFFDGNMPISELTKQKTKKINLQEMPKEEWDEARNPVYKHFDIDADYPELEGTITLCNDKIWDDIYDEYSMEQYPPFGGPFTNSLSFIHWLKQNYKAPQNRIK